MCTQTQTQAYDKCVPTNQDFGWQRMQQEGTRNLTGTSGKIPGIIGMYKTPQTTNGNGLRYDFRDDKCILPTSRDEKRKMPANFWKS